jgi:hypothetical protein
MGAVVSPVVDGCKRESTGKYLGIGFALGIFLGVWSFCFLICWSRISENKDVLKKFVLGVFIGMISRTVFILAVVIIVIRVSLCSGGYC